MRRFSLLIVVLTLALVAAACGGSDEITASNCFEIVDETVELYQTLIDDLDAEFEALTIDEFVAEAQDLELIATFQDDVEMIGDLSDSLGCTDEQIAAGIASQADSLSSKTIVGRLVIDALITGDI